MAASKPSGRPTWLAACALAACAPAPRAGDPAAAATAETGTIVSETGATAPCEGATDGPMERLWPAPGELYYAQLGLDGLALGEAALTVWPDGRVVAVDVGNDSHTRAIRGALEALVAEMATRGFGPRAATLDHVVLTHLHADHADGLADLLDDVGLRGRVVYRGPVDLGEVSGRTAEAVCEALAARPGAGLPLCVGGPPSCDPATWSGDYPADACDPSLADAALAIDDASGMQVVAVNGVIGGDRYERAIGPFAAESNGENARSLVAVLRHGPFRMLVAGDLTGGGSDTDAVEAFYLPRLPAVAGLDARGVDALLAGHHGRDTSTSRAWADGLLPDDGRPRHALIGVSQAHLGSPHAAVLDVLLDGRLAGGRAWTTRVASFGETHPELVDAGGGQVVLRTVNGGRGYVVQAIAPSGAVLASRRADAVYACP